MDSSRTILNRLLRKRSGPHLSSRRVAACLQGGNEIPIASNLEKRIFRSFSYRGKIRAIIIYWRNECSPLFVHWNWLSLLSCRNEGWWFTRVKDRWRSLVDRLTRSTTGARSLLTWDFRLFFFCKRIVLVSLNFLKPFPIERYLITIQFYNFFSNLNHRQTGTISFLLLLLIRKQLISCSLLKNNLEIFVSQSVFDNLAFETTHSV